MPAIVEQLPTSDDEEETPTPTPLPVETQQATSAGTPAEETGAEATTGSSVAQPQDPSERAVDVELCGQLKNAGNQLFKEGNVSEALATYRRALWYAPLKPAPVRAVKSQMPKPPAEAGEAAQDVGEANSEPEEDAPLDTTDYTLTAQVYCNAGFCLMKLDVKEEATQMLSEAIRHDEQYQKAYLRRADCYYDLQKWSNAYGDYESYEKLGGVLDGQGRARKTAAKAKVDEEMQKMLGELKNIGNKILGNFGLSTDNFKFDKDPNTGGYSMRFER